MARYTGGDVLKVCTGLYIASITRKGLNVASKK